MSYHVLTTCVYYTIITATALLAPLIYVIYLYIYIYIYIYTATEPDTSNTSGAEQVAKICPTEVPKEKRKSAHGHST